MAGVKSSFVTGSRAKIKIGEKLVAFATDIFYDVKVETLPIRAMGKYELYANEVVEYTVSGGFSIVRYTSEDAKKAISGQVLNNTGNAPAMAVLDANGQLSGAASAPGSHLDPSGILSSPTFDIEILQKVPSRLPVDKKEAVKALSNADLIAGREFSPKFTIDYTVQNDASLFVIKDCRITGRRGSLTKKTLLIEQFSFVGLIAGDRDQAVTPSPVFGVDDKGKINSLSFVPLRSPDPSDNGAEKFGNSSPGRDGQ